MSSLNRYPTWALLAIAVVAAVAVVARYMRMDRGANPRILWLKVLAVFLILIPLAWLGVIVSRTGQRITPNEGLLVVADILAGLLVLSIPAGRALRRLTDAELRQIRRRLRSMSSSLASGPSWCSA